MEKGPNSRRLAGLGFEFAAAVGGCTLVGYWIGNHYGRADLGVLAGAVFGLIGGMYNLIRATLAASGGAAHRKRKESSEDNG